MEPADLAHVLLALALLMLAAHLLGGLFSRFRQPRVIGEILGGLLLGPTVLGALAPGATARLFPATGVTGTVLDLVYQLGLLLLMFCSGTEIRAALSRGDGRTVGAVTVVGMLVPFLAGLGVVRLLNLHRYWGPNASRTSFLLVFAIAVAVTSIPVISRIMYDLRILDTRFARVVLGVAVFEDVALYVVLAIALGAATGGGATAFGLPAALSIAPGSGADFAYHTTATLGLLALFLLLGPRVHGWLARQRLNVLAHRSPIAHELVFMLLATVACLFLGVEAFFGAFVAGVVVGTSERVPEHVVRSIKEFSFAFFVPVYFAIVGLHLDLLHGFSVAFFGAFFVFACLVKAASVYGGARVAGEPSGSAWNLAVAMNARGGPGIVLASVALQAGIVNEPFYATLVLLAVLTSLVAGSWLERVPRDQLLGKPQATQPNPTDSRTRP